MVFEQVEGRPRIVDFKFLKAFAAFVPKCAGEVSEADAVPRTNSPARSTQHTPDLFADWFCKQHLHYALGTVLSFECSINARTNHARIIEDEKVGWVQDFW